MLTEEKCLALLADVKATCSNCKFEKGSRSKCDQDRCLIYGLRAFPLQQQATQERIISELLRKMKKEN